MNSRLAFPVLAVALLTILALSACLGGGPAQLQGSSQEIEGRPDSESRSGGTISKSQSLQVNFGACIQDVPEAPLCANSHSEALYPEGPLLVVFETRENATEARFSVDWDQRTPLTQELLVRILAVESCEKAGLGWGCDSLRTLDETTGPPMFEWTDEAPDLEPGEQYAVQIMPVVLGGGHLGIMGHETIQVSGSIDWGNLG